MTTDLTEHDQQELAKFKEFLRIVGTPTDVSVRERLKEAGREDLLKWALGFGDA